MTATAWHNERRLPEAVESGGTDAEPSACRDFSVFVGASAAVDAASVLCKTRAVAVGAVGGVIDPPEGSCACGPC
jgi:hypothetical protein